MLNRVELIGHMGNDPELKVTPGGKSVASFSIATTERWKDANGEKKEKTEWHRCTAWERTADVIAKYCHKGSKVRVEGKLETQSYEKDGEKKSVTKIIVREVLLLDKKDGDSAPRSPSPPRSSAPRAPSPPPANVNSDHSEDFDIPF